MIFSDRNMQRLKETVTCCVRRNNLIRVINCTQLDGDHYIGSIPSSMTM